MSVLNFSINGKSIHPTIYEGFAREFKITVDEPEALGGKNSAPNPVEYILAGYAGCLNVVFHLIAQELQIKINALNINIDGDINPSKFLGKSNEDRAGFKSLNVHIELDTDAGEEQEKLLIYSVKERCPVNDNLTNVTLVNYLVTKPINLN